MMPVINRSARCAEVAGYFIPSTKPLNNGFDVQHEATLADFLTPRNNDCAAGVSFSFRPEQMSGGIVGAMEDTLEVQVARRLKSIRAELNMEASAMAEWLDVGRTRYLNWERADNLPNERFMASLCDRTGVTMDYIYRGRMDGIKLALAIRLAAREAGQNPDEPGFQPEEAMAAAAKATQPA